MMFSARNIMLGFCFSIHTKALKSVYLQRRFVQQRPTSLLRYSIRNNPRQRLVAQMASSNEKSIRPMTSGSKGSVWVSFSRVFVPLWLIIAPMATVIWIVLSPYLLVRRFLRSGPRCASELQVETIESTSSKRNGGKTLFFIHGWPDDASLWKQQVDFFSSHGHNCIAVTLPNYDGKGGGWGPGFDELVDTLITAVESALQGSGGPVVLFCHDWGSVLGQLIAKRRPDLVSHLILVDVGASLPQTPSFKLFAASYQCSTFTRSF